MQTEPQYGLPYLEGSDRAKDIPENSRQLALTMADAMTRAGLAPDRGDLVTLLDRLKRLEDNPPPASITITQKTNAPWGTYAVVEARAGGFVPGNGLIGKHFAYDFDETHPGVTGEAFAPPRERVDSYGKRTGYNVSANASGWYIYDSKPGMLRGPQIRGGKIFHDFDAKNLNGSPAGIEALGLTKDGHLRCYSALRGDTAASMVAAGVTDSWSYGPNLVIDGVPVDLDANPTGWQYFSKLYRPDGPGTPIVPQISARTIIGQRQNGDVVIISTIGRTGSVGITGNDMVSLATSEGLFNASLMDGGGSSQIWAEGYYTIPSSDTDGPASNGGDGTFARRSVPDAFLLRGILTTPALDTGWTDIPLRAGYVTNGGTGNTPQIRQLDGVTEMRGQIKRSAGNFLGDGVSVMVADLPQQFGIETGAKPFTVTCDAANTRKMTVQSDRSIQVVGGTNTPAYVVLDNMRWGTYTK